MACKISVVIPYYENFPSKKEILARCTKSLVGHDEIIIVWNDRMGFSPAINRGLATASGDFIFVINDDVIQEDGNIKSLCLPNIVTAPIFNGEERAFHGSAFCLPREIYEKVGPMWEGYDTSYFDDEDYLNRLMLHEVSMCNVPINFSHPVGGTTLEALPDRDKFFETNEERFIERWGDTPDESRAFYRENGKFPRTPNDA